MERTHKLTILVNSNNLELIKKNSVILFEMDIDDNIHYFDYDKYSKQVLNTIKELFNANLCTSKRRLDEYCADFSYMFYKIMRDKSKIEVIREKPCTINGIPQYRKITKTKHLLSLSKVGKYLGKDHATVSHGLNRFVDFYESDKVFASNYNLLLSTLK